MMMKYWEKEKKIENVNIRSGTHFEEKRKKQ
jgi:hypothetical protein